MSRRYKGKRAQGWEGARTRVGGTRSRGGGLKGGRVRGFKDKRHKGERAQGCKSEKSQGCKDKRAQGREGAKDESSRA